jgi:hypothetical protein
MHRAVAASEQLMSLLPCASVMPGAISLPREDQIAEPLAP